MTVAVPLEPGDVLVKISRVALLPAVTVGWLKLPVTPGGSPETLRLTGVVESVERVKVVGNPGNMLAAPVGSG